MSDSSEPGTFKVRAKVVHRPVSEPTTYTVRVVHREDGEDLNSYRTRQLEENLRRPRQETVFEQAERERTSK